MAPIEAEPPVTPASVSESISAAAAAPSADSFLAHAETVQQALNSGDDAGIRAILPLAGDEKPAPEFAQTIASLELVLDKSSQKTLAPDLWEVQANDKYGMSWTLGILQVDGTPKLMYAERTLP
ncbi:hypothetical protein [Arthrobacter sp.]|uniref:hypothetical protein n=1 Tax=Arthrobacter sp. TaxID=1667 RepID=UPI0026E000A2|nr:hypothetical protein [Arthrobacter sp.]MDO5752705.1 hypothetical protein [Arthrobacter sp.]